MLQLACSLADWPQPSALPPLPGPPLSCPIVAHIAGNAPAWALPSSSLSRKKDQALVANTKAEDSRLQLTRRNVSQPLKPTRAMTMLLGTWCGCGVGVGGFGYPNCPSLDRPSITQLCFVSVATRTTPKCL